MVLMWLFWKLQNSVAANVTGTIGTILWCLQLVPQIWYNYKRKQTDGIVSHGPYRLDEV